MNIEFIQRGATCVSKFFNDNEDELHDFLDNIYEIADGDFFIASSDHLLGFKASDYDEAFRCALKVLQYDVIGDTQNF